MNRLFVWLMRTLLVLGVSVAVVRPNVSRAQSSSLFRRASANTPGLAVRPAGEVAKERKVSLGRVSYFAIKPLPKRVFKVHDLVTVIVREKSTYKHDGKSDLEREVEYKAELKDWIRLKSWKLIPDTLPAGDPKIDFKMSRAHEGEGKKNRSDEVITRITCEVIDVRANKTLVLDGKPVVIETDGEKQIITLTGTCRSEDVGADNTILSTQISELHFTRKSTGAVRDAMRRGWAYKIWDKIRPF